MLTIVFFVLTGLWRCHCWAGYVEWRFIQGQHPDHAAIARQFDGKLSVFVWNFWSDSPFFFSCGHQTHRETATSLKMLVTIDKGSPTKSTEFIKFHFRFSPPLLPFLYYTRIHTYTYKLLNFEKHTKHIFTFEYCVSSYSTSLLPHFFRTYWVLFSRLLSVPNISDFSCNVQFQFCPKNQNLKSQPSRRHQQHSSPTGKHTVTSTNRNTNTRLLFKIMGSVRSYHSLFVFSPFPCLSFYCILDWRRWWWFVN